MMTRIPVLLAAAIACAARATFAASVSGAGLASACASCHRLDGRDAGIPAVVGLDETAITQAMLAYRAGARPSQIMHVVANALTPDEITDVARYLAGLKPGASQ